MSKNKKFSMAYDKRRKIYNLISIYNNNKFFIISYILSLFGKYKNPHFLNHEANEFLRCYHPD